MGNNTDIFEIDYDKSVQEEQNRLLAVIKHKKIDIVLFLNDFRFPDQTFFLNETIAQKVDCRLWVWDAMHDINDLKNHIYLYSKIYSFEINDIPLIKQVAKVGKPIIMSTGVADYNDIKIALDACYEMGNKDVSLLKCTSEYPASLEQANLLTIPDMIATFKTVVGVSDHTMGSVVPMTSVALGARIVEKHFILDRSLGGPDSSFSMEPQEFKKMVDDVRDVESALGGIKREISDRERAKRRAIYAIVDINPGDIFTVENTKSFRPADGLSPVYYEQMLGQIAKRYIPMGEPLQLSDIDINNKII